ncbi:hypothetical protein [Methylobacterium sp. GC_Met_2]|uniref:hypothetical protein n=1 Tax=Methylobacterium sp. GC_Met_2 TaxID=2937376 RepID=UPI00226B3561|nr:hypothetical protein [Methylobacterium sp. GC_Met_2]
MNDFPRDAAEAERQWDAVVKANAADPGPQCRTLDCKRAEAARRLEEVTFPKDVVERFLAWLDGSGRRSPFLDPDLWVLDASRAEPLWARRNGQIVYYGDLPDWLRSEIFERPPSAALPRPAADGGRGLQPALDGGAGRSRSDTQG